MDWLMVGAWVVTALVVVYSVVMLVRDVRKLNDRRK
jgi:uncharacterized membrane protein YcjF (UPF0283 family)